MRKLCEVKQLKKYKVFVNYQKEERWINEMAAAGWHLIKYSFLKYTFEKGEPGKYDYCIELLADLPATDKGKEYLSFMEEAGVEHVTQYSSWAYFRKEATGEPFEIYTDYESRKKHLMRIITLLSVVMLMNLGFSFFNLFIASDITLNINKYFSILNGIVVIIFIPLIIGYIKNLYELTQDK